MMSIFTKILAASLLFGQLCFSGTQFELKIDTRKAIIYAPQNLNNPALVISMHGIGIPASWNQGMMKYEPIADTGNFVVAFPEGVDLKWDMSSDKDVKFITAIIDSMSTRYKIDRNRVYASGFSMGAMMSWYLSCKIPDKIAAIVPGNGYPLSGLSGCSEVRHVPVLQLYGTADSYYGKFHTDFLPSQISRYGCSSSATKTKPYPVDVNGRNASQLAQASQSFKETYAPCEKSGLTSEITIISITGMIHDWATPGKANANSDLAYKGKPFDVNGSWEAWNWMKTQSLAGSVPVVTVPAHRDTIFNGGFDQGSLGWSLNTWSGTAEGSVASNEYKIAITAAGTGTSGIQLVQNGLILVQGKSYQVSFDAYASASRTLEANMELDVSPWTSYLPALKSFDLTTTKTTYTYSFDMTNATDSNARISFNAGASTETIFLDKISIKEVQGPVYVRDTKAQLARISVAQNQYQVELTLNGVQGSTISVGLYDFMGKSVRASLLRIDGQGKASWQADLQGIPQGIYILKVDGNGKTLRNSKILIGK